MDPPHITEFASQRYFEKLKQINGSEQPQDATVVAAAASGSATVASASPFILPLRGSKAHDDDAEVLRPESKKPEKSSRFFGTLRSKGKDLFHSKASSTLPTTELPIRTSSISLSAATRHIPFDQRFLALPNELQIQILSSLPLHDILTLRMTSKSWHALISLHEAPIVRYHLEHHIPAYANRLYPVTDLASASLHHLCGLWHRLHVSAKLSYLMCEWITKEIFLRTTEAQRLEFAPQRERMRRRLIPLVFTVFHFFESYRRLQLEHILDNDGHGLLHQPYTLNPIETRIMAEYDDQTLLRVHEAFPLVISSFCRRLRPPTYVGRVERTMRGYLREKPSDEMHAAILCIGGMRQVERIWETKGYNLRRGAVDDWYASLIREPVEATKAKRGLLSLSRKKSSMAIKDTSKPATNDAYAFGRRTNSIPEDGVCTGGSWNLIFSTSLAAGMPMALPSPEDARRLVADLPVLQQIWTTTAEALILERKIVERPMDIKRNQQVMMDLIREDGLDEEDEWWYGRATPDSVRPPQDAIDDDLIIEGVPDI